MEKKFEFTGNHTMEKLLSRAVNKAKPIRGTCLKQFAVMAIFGCSVDTAAGLCNHFEINPKQPVSA